MEGEAGSVGDSGSFEANAAGLGSGLPGSDSGLLLGICGIPLLSAAFKVIVPSHGSSFTLPQGFLSRALHQE